MKKVRTEKTPVQLVDSAGEVIIENAVLYKGNGLCTIYDMEEEYFKFTCTSDFELNAILSTHGLQIKIIEKGQRNCSECGKSMQEGFYFESDGTYYCSEECLTKVISWKEYMKIHDNGNGDAYWTDWYDG